MKPKVLVLDFDNVIILDPKTRQGSQEVKDGAWISVFPFEKDKLLPILEKAEKEISGGRGDRRDIVRIVLEHFGITATSELIEKYCEKFDQVLQEGIMRIGVSSSTRSALKKLASQVPLYINTATPTKTIAKSLTSLNIVDLFKQVYGRPGTKVENLQNIIRQEQTTPDKIMFIGDQMSDYLAAYTVGCQFVGMHTAKNKWEKEKFQIIYSLEEIPKII